MNDGVGQILLSKRLFWLFLKSFGLILRQKNYEPRSYNLHSGTVSQIKINILNAKKLCVKSYSTWFIVHNKMKIDIEFVKSECRRIRSEASVISGGFQNRER